jgi:hypothetical protein
MDATEAAAKAAYESHAARLHGRLAPPWEQLFQQARDTWINTARTLTGCPTCHAKLTCPMCTRRKRRAR